MHAQSQSQYPSTRRVRARVERAVEQGNQRRVTIRRKGRSLVELPLTVALIAMIVAPPLALVTALAVAFFDTTVDMRTVEDTGTNEPM